MIFEFLAYAIKVKRGVNLKDVNLKDADLPRLNKIELINSVLTGPFKKYTMKGGRYYQTVSDDYSHFVQVGIIKIIKNQGSSRTKY